MTDTYFSIPLRGRELKGCSPDNLSIQRAREVAQALLSGTMNWVTFVGSYQHLSSLDGKETILAETLVFDAEVELPQKCAYEIARIERIAVTFRADDKHYPGVYALREGFPEVLHLNLEPFEFPRSLCLFDEPYSDVKLRWTAIGFIERIRRWLADTATGTLHRKDQPVENLLVGTNTPLVLPSKVFSASEFNTLPNLHVSYNKWGKNLFFIAQEEEFNKSIRQSGHSFSFISISGSPQPQSKLRKTPDNLVELDEFLKTAQINFLEEVRVRVKELNRDPNDQRPLQAGLIILITLPIARVAGGAVERIEVWAFVCLENSGEFCSIRKIGEKIGVWDINDGQIGGVIFFDETKVGKEIKLLMLNPCSMLSRTNAPLFAGTNNRFANKITAVGMGALGSQIFLNIIKAADGEWTLIDKDILLPHNFTRHAAYGFTVGYPKTEIMAHVGNATIEAPSIAKQIMADILNPDGEMDAVNNSLSEAQVILDCSASVAVARHLGLDVESNARRISFFLNPAGDDLVLLAEDSNRNMPLDVLEMQYYRLLIGDENLRDHLRPPKGQVRYSTGCREVSSQISPDTVALCAAIGSQALRQLLRQEDAVISLWRVGNDGQVRKYSAAPTALITEQVNGWTIRTDEFLLNKLRQKRTEKLPVETGGTLIGSYDMQRKIIYVVDTVPAPPDSVESPTSFIRGSYGLKPVVEEIKKITLENLQNVGEWHSHPSGYSSNPSGDDKILLESLSDNLRKDGKPALMLIIGDKNNNWNLA